MSDAITEMDVHAYIDGALPPERAAEVEAAMAQDTVLAARIRGFQADKDALIAAFRAFDDMPVPAVLLDGAMAPVDGAMAPGPTNAVSAHAASAPAVAAPPVSGPSISASPSLPAVEVRTAASTPSLRLVSDRPVAGPAGGPWKRLTRPNAPWGRRVAVMGAAALAASLMLALVPHAPRGSAIDQALAARQNTSTPSRELNGADQATMQLAADAMTAMLGNHTRVPDLRRAGFNLVSADVYGEKRSDAVQLRYEDSGRRLFTVYLRPSAGPDSFEVTERGPVRICLWQNADVTAVMTGEFATPELFRLASLTYTSLGL